MSPIERCRPSTLPLTDKETTAPPSDADLHATATIEYRAEVIRKGIHLASLSIPIIYALVSKTLALQMLVPVTLAFLVVDLARYYFPAVGELFYKVFGWLLRRHEQDGKKKRLNGATYVLLSAVFCVVVFPKLVTLTAFSILIISDSTSALVGRRFGRRPFFRKSLEGALAFFVSAVLVVMVAPKAGAGPIELLIGIIASAVGAVVESASTIDDNISIPVSIGLVMWALYALLLPGTDLSGPPPLF